MPLTLAQVGERATVCQISGQDEQRRFLAGMGFTVGGEVTVVSKLGGNLIVNVMGTRVALGHGLAKRILVKPC